MSVYDDWAIVGAAASMGVRGVRQPCRGGMRPVNRLACEIHVFGACAYAFSNRTPSLARASITGVSTPRNPLQPRWSGRRQSSVSSTTFGLVSDKASSANLGLLAQRGHDGVGFAGD